MKARSLGCVFQSRKNSKGIRGSTVSLSLMQGTASNGTWGKFCPGFAPSLCDRQQGELGFLGFTVLK